MNVPPSDNDEDAVDLTSNSSCQRPTTYDAKSFARPKKRLRFYHIRVRSNPDNYILDFEGTSTVEGRLSKLLESGRQSISLVGLPGCGKTVILRALAYHPLVKTRFCKGVFLIPLSYRTGALALLAYLSKILDYLDLPQHANNVRNMVGLPEQDFTDADSSNDHNSNGDVDIGDIDFESINKSSAALCSDSISKATNYVFNVIYDMGVLLLFDNIDIRAKEVLSVIECLNHVIPGSRQFSLICSTRNRDIALAFVFNNSTDVLDVKLLDPLGETSRAILCTHAGHKLARLEDESRIPENSVVPVLQKCSGIPLALAVAGGALQRLQSCPREAIERKIWRNYKTFMFSDVEQFGTLCKMFPSLHACVETLPTVPKDKWDLVSSLGVIPNATWLPFPILKRLWGVEPDDVDKIVRHLLVSCLVRKVERDINCGIFVPNLVLDFFRVEASKRGGLQKWHLSLLSSYLNHEVKVNKSGKSGTGGKRGRPNTSSRPGKPGRPGRHIVLEIDSAEQFYLEQHLAHHYRGATTADACLPKGDSDTGQRRSLQAQKSNQVMARSAKKFISERIINLSKERPVVLYR